MTRVSFVGEHVQGHLGGNLRQALHLKVSRTHPHLERTEGMLDCLTAHAHRTASSTCSGAAHAASGLRSRWRFGMGRG